MPSQAHLRQRLLQDVDELCRKPYPNIHLHVHDGDLTRFCLILSPPSADKLHLTVSNLENYPLDPPVVRMDSEVTHPNVYGDYICASILNTSDGYTPAYTLKSIAIQLLSFFSSDNIEQDSGDMRVNLEQYRKEIQDDDYSDVSFEDHFKCRRCGFNSDRQQPAKQPPKREVPGTVCISGPSPRRTRRGRGTIASTESPSADSAFGTPGSPHALEQTSAATDGNLTMDLGKIPTEILLIILKKVEDFEDLTNLARVSSRVSQVITEFDILRQRELQCFVLKKTYHEVKLGVGVYGDTLSIGSEFDLLSQEAYTDLRVRASVYNMPFDRWLALPISRPHWQLVREYAHSTLEGLKKFGCVKHEKPTNAQVLYQFMTDVVIKLNKVGVGRRGQHNTKSTLRHASDRAIESYFHLFHLLVCLATEDAAVVHAANRLLNRFRDGHRSKAEVPNLGHLLVALLISDVEVTQELRKAIVTEAITRNVVWTLKDYPQLAYKEPDEVSAYRLDKTFQASRTSYRLLTFSELFRRTARPDNKVLVDVREQLFDRHGGPPHGTAAHVASEVRRLHGVNDFTHFLREMGFESIPTAAGYTRFLRRTLDDSVQAGYSREAITQSQALALRLPYDSMVGIQADLRSEFNTWNGGNGTFRLPRVPVSRLNFFPPNSSHPNNGGRGGNSGIRGRSRGSRGGRSGRR